MGNLSIAYVVLAFALAVGGGALGASLGSSHQRLCALISLGAGTLLGVTVFAILPESFEALHWWGVLLAVGSGYAVFFVDQQVCLSHLPGLCREPFRRGHHAPFQRDRRGHDAGAGHSLHGRWPGPGRGPRGGSLARARRAGCSTSPSSWPFVSTRCRRAWRSAPCCWARASTARKPWCASRRWNQRPCSGGLLGWVFLRHISAFWLDATVAHVGGGFLFLAVHAVFGEILKHHKALVLTNFAPWLRRHRRAEPVAPAALTCFMASLGCGFLIDPQAFAHDGSGGAASGCSGTDTVARSRRGGRNGWRQTDGGVAG